MPMPTLDPSRHFAVVLADPSHKLPLPERGGRHFLREGEVIDSADPFYAHLLADGSLKRKPPEKADVETDDASDKSEAPKDDKPALPDSARRQPAPIVDNKAPKGDPAS